MVSPWAKVNIDTMIQDANYMGKKYANSELTNSLLIKFGKTQNPMDAASGLPNPTPWFEMEGEVGFVQAQDQL